MSVSINPGAEPVEDATEANAIQSIEQFLIALQLQGGLEQLEYDRRSDLDRDGRYGFCLFFAEDSWYRPSVNVLMPGCDPDLTQAGIPWRSPRLYVNGGRWLWGYALDIADGRLRGGEDDES